MKASLRLLMAIFIFTIAITSCKSKPEVDSAGPLPRSTPEAEGVPSESLSTFLDTLAAHSRNEFHSIMILRHGKVIAEGWWSPYQADLRHTLYSTSKSFTSTAVGFAVAEKRLSLTDKVISFFPEDTPDSVSENLARLTVKDLLMMSAGQDPDPTYKIQHNKSDSSWVKIFFNTPVINQPGTKFLYNSLATYMLSAIVQKVTGEKVIDYLGPRLFEPLGIKGMDWEEDPNGINTGGWGLRIKTEDMAKFGQLLLQKGSWYGKQLIPSAWIEEATTFKIDQAPEAPQSKKDSSDWMQGYCYQFWRCRNNAFRADGAFGQYIIVMPEKDAVIAITSESPSMQEELNLIWNYLLPAFKIETLPDNQVAINSLKEKLSKLSLSPLPSGVDTSGISKISGQTFQVASNDFKLQSIGFSFEPGICHLSVKLDTLKYALDFGDGYWAAGETLKPGPNLVNAINNIPSKITGCYTWIDNSTLKLVLQYIESPHHETYICKFNNKTLDLSYSPSFFFGAKPVKFSGKKI